MFDWIRPAPRYTLASPQEREALLEKSHPVFREVDAAFHVYLEEVIADPGRDDSVIEQAVLRRGITARLADDCVAFGPLAWGRVVAESLGVEVSPVFRLVSRIDESEGDYPLAHELTYAWARGLIDLYRTPERNEVFKLVAQRSAEVNAINNALNEGVSAESLRGGQLQPPWIRLLRSAAPG